MAERAVYVGTHAWGSPIRVGSHHFAAQISRYYDTLYVCHPLTPLAAVNTTDNSFAARWRGRTWVPPELTRLKQFTPLMLLSSSDKPLLNTALVARLSPWLALPPLSTSLRHLGFRRPDVLVLDTCFQSFWPRLLQPSYTIVRVADNPTGFGAHFQGGVARAWYRCLRDADLVICPSEPIARYLADLDVDAHVIPNGVDIEHVAQPTERPPEFRQVQGPVALYVGALAPWFDLELLAATAQRLPHVCFFIIGPRMMAVDTQLPANVHLLGPRPYADIAAYYAHADVALVPFDVAAHRTLIEAVDAIKIYEYLAAGLPVVATRWSQTLRLAPYVGLAGQCAQDFAEQISAALLDGPPQIPEGLLDSWSWRARFAQIMSAAELPTPESS